MSDTNIAAAGKTGASHSVKSDVERLGHYVGQLHDDLAGIAKGAGEVAQSGVAAVKESGKNALEAAKEKSGLAAASLRSRIANHPGASLGIALGVGLLIGLLAPAVVRSRRSVS